jgi:hypothetical protein
MLDLVLVAGLPQFPLDGLRARQGNDNVFGHQNLAFFGCSTFWTSMSGREAAEVFGCSITIRMVLGEAARRFATGRERDAAFRAGAR